MRASISDGDRPFRLDLQTVPGASKGDVDIILAWLDGYYRAEDDPPVIDRDQLAANARKVAAFCSTHPDVKLITAAGTLFERE